MDFGGYFSALLEDTVALLSTIGSIVLLLIGLWYYDHPIPRWITLLIAVLCFVFASMRIWDKENKKFRAECERNSGPEIFIRCGIIEGGRFLHGELPPKTFILENTGNIDAYDVQIEPIAITKVCCEALFEPVARIAAKNEQPATISLRGNNLPSLKHECGLEMVVFCSGLSVANDQRTVFSLPVIVTFRDYGQRLYRAHFTFTTDHFFGATDIKFNSRERLTQLE